MARNRGKTPGASSGSKPQNTDQVSKTDQARPDAAAKPTGTAPASAAKVDAKSAGAASNTSTTSTVTTSTSSSGPARADRKIGAGSGSVPGVTSQDVKKPAPTASVAQPLSVTHGDKPSHSGGFWPGLLGGLLGGAAMALAAFLFLFGENGGEAVTNLQSTTANLDSRMSAMEGEVQAMGPLAERVAAGDELIDRLSDVEQKMATFTGASGGSSEAATTASGSGEGLPDINDRLAALEQQLAAMSKAQQSASDTLAALPSFEATLSTTEATVAMAGQQTAALSGSVDTLQRTTESLDADLGTLTERIDRAENELDNIGGAYQRAAAMVVAIGDIDRSIARAEPYETALHSLRALGKDAPEVAQAIAALEPMAAQGVPTLTTLKASFGDVGSRILLAEDGSGTLVDQVSDNLFGIINMRPAGAAVEGDDGRAIVARAQAKLSADDLEGTIAELAGLSAASLESADGWLADAKGRLSADAAVDDLRAHAQSLLATGS